MLLLLDLILEYLLPLHSLISNLCFQIVYSTGDGEFQALQLIVFVVFGVFIDFTSVYTFTHLYIYIYKSYNLVIH